MSDLESQLRRLKFHPLPAEAKIRILPANGKPSRSHGTIWLASPLAALWLLILAFYFTTPDTPIPSGPSVNYTELQHITLLTKLQITMLENENRLPNCDGPSFSAPKHF